jgi:hypothetical protein
MMRIIATEIAKLGLDAAIVASNCAHGTHVRVPNAWALLVIPAIGNQPTKCNCKLTP